MIDESTTTVYVRVDLASRKVIGVSDSPLVERKGKPVFEVAANFSRLDYYIVEDDPSADYGISVRPVTEAERAAADEAAASTAATMLARAKLRKAVAIKDFYDDIFVRRFYARGFYSTTESIAAAIYEGTDTHMLDVVKPNAVAMLRTYNEWRHGVCQPVIDDMLASEGLGVELDEMYRNEVNATLDTFLTEKGFDINIYHR